MAELARRFSDAVVIDRLHASNIDDIHSVIGETDFDVIQFSGHGSEGGIYLDKRDMSNKGELVSPRRLQSLLSIASRPPLLVVLLACYATASRTILTDIAPFVVTTGEDVEDNACLEFVRGFYSYCVKNPKKSNIINGLQENMAHRKTMQFQYVRQNLTRSNYERLFAGYAIHKSFDDALAILRSKQIPRKGLRAQPTSVDPQEQR